MARPKSKWAPFPGPCRGGPLRETAGTAVSVASVRETGRAIERKKGHLGAKVHLEKQAGEQGTVAGAEIPRHRTGEGMGAQTNDVWCEAVPVWSVWGLNLDPQIPIRKPFARDQRVKNHVRFYKPTVRSSVWDWLLCRTSPT